MFVYNTKMLLRVSCTFNLNSGQILYTYVTILKQIRMTPYNEVVHYLHESKVASSWSKIFLFTKQFFFQINRVIKTAVCSLRCSDNCFGSCEAKWIREVCHFSSAAGKRNSKCDLLHVYSGVKANRLERSERQGCCEMKCLKPLRQWKLFLHLKLELPLILFQLLLLICKYGLVSWVGLGLTPVFYSISVTYQWLGIPVVRYQY